MKHRGDFFLGEIAVGHFEEFEAPLTSGRHQYEPYRGEGHRDMAAALDRGDQPRCWCIRDKGRLEFNVVREEFKAKHPQSEWWVTVVILPP
jgi:hypothetical protein